MKAAVFLPVCAGALLATTSAGAAGTNQWTFEVSAYFLTLGISGELGVGPVTADVDVGLDDILENLQFGVMGKVRAGYGRWGLTTEVLYMGLEGSEGNLTVELDQWMVEPTISCRLNPYVEPLAGVRYNNVSGELRGPGLLPTPHMPSGTQEWWDPILGANLTFPLGKGFSLRFRGDVGGFGVGSDLTWQAFPYVDWRFTRWGSAQLGYRWLYMDYETGSGADRFAYDMLNEGAQIGFTFHF